MQLDNYPLTSKFIQQNQKYFKIDLTLSEVNLAQFIYKQLLQINSSKLNDGFNLSYIDTVEFDQGINFINNLNDLQEEDVANGLERLESIDDCIEYIKETNPMLYYTFEENTIHLINLQNIENIFYHNFAEE